MIPPRPALRLYPNAILPTPITLIPGAEAAAEFMRPWVDAARVETFWIIPLGLERRLLTDAPIEISLGERSSVRTDISDIVRAAALLDADAICLVHNHPQGHSSIPSDADISSTQAVILGLSVVQIHCFDHIVMSSGSSAWTSIYKEYPELWPRNGQDVENWTQAAFETVAHTAKFMRKVETQRRQKMREAMGLLNIPGGDGIRGLINALGL